MDMTRVVLSDQTGAVIRYANMPSQFGILPRNVDVWLPPGYADATTLFPLKFLLGG